MPSELKEYILYILFYHHGIFHSFNIYAVFVFLFILKLTLKTQYTLFSIPRRMYKIKIQNNQKNNTKFNRKMMYN